jgi:histidinol-phosphatase (PHP family)
MLEAGWFDIIGHFDKIGHNAGHYKEGIETEVWYRKLVYDLMDLIIEKGVVVEINTKAWLDHHRLFPNVEWLPYLKEKGVPMIVNSDAHFPHLINASRDIAFAELEK